MSIEKLILAGGQLANVAYNWSQNITLDERDRRSAKRSQELWDSALAEYRKEGDVSIGAIRAAAAAYSADPCPEPTEPSNGPIQPLMLRIERIERALDAIFGTKWRDHSG